MKPLAAINRILHSFLLRFRAIYWKHILRRPRLIFTKSHLKPYKDLGFDIDESHLRKYNNKWYEF
jgi:hypothetical protein